MNSTAGRIARVALTSAFCRTRVVRRLPSKCSTKKHSYEGQSISDGRSRNYLQGHDSTGMIEYPGVKVRKPKAAKVSGTPRLILESKYADMLKNTMSRFRF